MPVGGKLFSVQLHSFAQRNIFNDSLYMVLNKIDKSALSYDGQINLELLKYDVEDEVASYKYKAYLNPILADEGFHTSYAGIGSQILSSKEEFENYRGGPRRKSFIFSEQSNLYIQSTVCLFL